MKIPSSKSQKILATKNNKKIKIEAFNLKKEMPTKV